MAKKAIQDRVPSEQPAATRNAPKTPPVATKNRGAGPLYVRGDYSRRKGDLLGLRDVQKEFGPRATKTVASGGDYGRRQAAARQRALEGAPFAERFRSAYYVGNPTNVRPQNMTVAQRMELQNKKLLGEYSRKDKPAPAPAAVKVKAKPAQVVSTTVRERITPTSAKAKAPARMAVNPRTGSTLGFTTGTRTGSTSFKPGVAGKTPMTGLQRMSQNAFNKGGVAGPSRSGGGSRSTSSRSTGGRSMGGGMGASGRGTGSKK